MCHYEILGARCRNDACRGTNPRIVARESLNW
jgi:hypothetical protein